jgi:hypothetical protein
VPHHIGMYVKHPDGKVWHIAELGGGRSLCGALSRRGAWLALFILEERAGGLPLCKRCRLSPAGRARLQPESSPVMTDSNSSRSSGLSR